MITSYATHDRTHSNQARALRPYQTKTGPLENILLIIVFDHSKVDFLVKIKMEIGKCTIFFHGSKPESIIYCVIKRNYAEESSQVSVNVVHKYTF